MKRFFPLLPLGLVCILLELASRNGYVPAYLLPAPSGIWNALIDHREKLGTAFLSTFGNAVLGLALSLVTGLLAGLLLASSRTLERVFYPYAVFFQTVPIISIAPLLVIWFGYGAPTVVASVFICSVFPVIANSLTGLKSADPLLMDLFRLYGASRTDLLLKLRLPSALPSILTGARIAAGMAVIGAIVGEFIAGGGLGGVLDEARLQQRMELEFASVLLSAALGLSFFAAVAAVSHYSLRHWHPSERRPS